MSVAAKHFDDIAQAFAAKDEAARTATAGQVAELFAHHASSFNDQHIALFDQVISILAEAIEVRARARLAERLADVPNAPPGIIRRFSRDDISVARPVLARSPQLSDDDLIEAARSGGRDHMLAISERKTLSEPVTDVLVNEGDRVVVNAVVSNPNARFSEGAYDTLVTRSGSDELLQAAIGRRRDIPPRHMSVLFELAKKAARERLESEIAQVGRRAVRDAVNTSAKDIAAETTALSEAYKQAIADVTALANRNELNEVSLGDYARKGQIAHVICAIAVIGKVPVSLPERALTGGDHDLLLILAKSLDLPWPTVRAMIAMRKDQKFGPRQFEQFAESYARLAPATAERLLHYLHAREAVVTRR